MRASFIYHQVTAVLEIIATPLVIYYLIKNRKSLSWLQISEPLLKLAIVWGIHCLIHFAEEYIYDFEPISGSTKVLNYPIRRVSVTNEYLNTE